jgi:hypothetical protein
VEDGFNQLPESVMQYHGGLERREIGNMRMSKLMYEMVRFSAQFSMTVTLI